VAGCRAIALAVLVALTACGTAYSDEPTVATPPPPTTVAVAPSTTATTAPPTTLAPTTTVPTRIVTEEQWTPFATVGGLVLLHPSSRVERIGFHESNNDGARELEALPTAVAPVTLESRERDNPARTAADVVVDPTLEIRAPVTGTVIRAGTYTLYCDYTDNFVVIEPDDHPGWEVKVLHIDGLLVGRGDRVIAGQTAIAPKPRQLPFESQVDEIRTVDPAWPHVHIEVVDPSIPDRPGEGCP
jgi:murein DD-endopeptidase MepM/ murein hydrolase activator NlpD